MKLRIYGNHICELRSVELFEERSSQLYTQLVLRQSAVYGVKLTLLRKFYQICSVQYFENYEAEI